MKKYIYSLIVLLAGVTFMTSCEKAEGTLPGNDTQAFATIGLSSPALPYDADSDVAVRIAANNVTEAVYYFAEPTAQKEARNLPESEYGNYVKQNGTKVDGFTPNEMDGAKYKDVVLQGLGGDNTITVVAENANGQYVASTTFFGVKWDTVCTGTYYFSVANVQKIAGATSVQTTLQRRSDIPEYFRFKNLFDVGKNLEFRLVDNAGTVRVDPQGIGLNFGSYGEASVRDVANWQGDDGYIDNFIDLDTFEAYFWVQYYVSAGNMGYGYDEFYPD